ncbi:MAG: hypothetical protein LQ337_000269 [Flavoplaca oasis]|nr:MAG: hypothetical protein LQ337_000269 [Flavoplaca oasis]
MANIDDLFKPQTAADTSYKVPKVSLSGGSKSNEKATVEDEAENDDDIEAGPALPPDEVEDGIGDEDGRFFGGGITSGTAEALDYIDEQDEGDGMLTVGRKTVEKIDASWLRKVALNFERRISRNSELRAKFEDDPQKFMGSEADLDADVKALSILSDHPDLYGDFAKLGCVASLVSLLAHENTDIAIDAIEIIKELTDEDVEAEQEQWDLLVDAMLEADLLNLLYGNAQRLEEANESDRAAVLENLSSRTAIAESLGQNTSFIPWLLKRVQQKESVVSQNKQYSAELLAILLQSSSQNRTLFFGLDGIDILLQLLSFYRKRDPTKGTEEEEYMENVFDSVTCCLDDTDGKIKFLEAEGIELCLIMLREGKMSKPRALRLLDHALGGLEGGPCCQKLVEAAGLKAIFTAFMKKGPDSQAIEHLLGILASMLRSLPSNSAERIRLLAKFVEKDYEKLDRTMRIRREYAAKVAAVDQDIQREKSRLSTQERDERGDEWLSRRMDAGLYALQTADVVLAWLVAEDEGAKERIQGLLADRDESLDVVRATLQEQLRESDTDAEDSDRMFQEMLTALIEHLH